MDDTDEFLDRWMQALPEFPSAEFLIAKALENHEESDTTEEASDKEPNE